MQQCIKILLIHIYMKLNMFRATHRPSSGAWNCTGSLWFFIRGRLLDVDVVRHSMWPTTFNVWKTRGCQCSFRLLMMGGVSPETCWASYKYGIIKCWYIVAYCWIFLYILYYDARIHEHQILLRTAFRSLSCLIRQYMRGNWTKRENYICRPIRLITCILFDVLELFLLSFVTCRPVF